MDKEQKRRFSALSGSIKRTDKEVDRLFNRAVAQVVALIQSLGISLDGIPDGDRFLQIHPEIDRGIRRITNDLAGDLLQSMQAGILNGWDLAQEHADDLLTAYVGNYTPAQQNLLRSSLLSRREGASMEFLRSRLEDRVSGSVWQTSEQARRHITSSVASALEEGVSADDLSRWIRNDLREPNRLFRRVRDKKSGKLRLSAPAKAYHPGQGVYRSSYKNAKRLARTEINIAYRSSDYDRWQDKDFVLGIKVQLSNNHTCNGVPFTDICDDLQGVYPKDFKFTGWHPQCRCIATPILEDRQHYLERRLHGKGEAPEPIKELPEGFSKWMEANKDRLELAKQKGTLPYFVKDNEKKIYKPKKRIRTKAEKDDIQRRWNTRMKSRDEDREKVKLRRWKTQIVRRGWMVEDEDRTALTNHWLDLEEKLKIRKRGMMGIERADKQSANPHHGEGRPYSINCQTCAPAYVLRRWGFDVIAKGNTRGSLSEYVSRGRSFDLWKNLDGSKASPVKQKDWMQSKKYKRMSENRWKEYLEENCEENGTYVLTINWKGGGGHATIIEKTPNGLFYVEPQVYNNAKGVFRPISDLCKDGAAVPWASSGILRVDNKLFNEEFLSLFEKRT